MCHISHLQGLETCSALTSLEHICKAFLLLSCPYLLCHQPRLSRLVAPLLLQSRFHPKCALSHSKPHTVPGSFQPYTFSINGTKLQHFCQDLCLPFFPSLASVACLPSQYPLSPVSVTATYWPPLRPCVTDRQPTIASVLLSKSCHVSTP